MKLTKRAALVILPVIVASYMAVAVRVYQELIDSRITLEQARFDTELTNLQSTFRSYDSTLAGYLTNIRVSERLRLFLTEQDDRFRNVALGEILEEMIASSHREEHHV